MRQLSELVAFFRHAGQHRRGNHPRCGRSSWPTSPGWTSAAHHGGEAPVRYRQEQADLRRGRSHSPSRPLSPTAMRSIDQIIVHCSATRGKGSQLPSNKSHTVASAAQVRDIGYHYVVYLDGTVHSGPTLEAGAQLQKATMPIPSASAMSAGPGRQTQGHPHRRPEGSAAVVIQGN